MRKRIIEELSAKERDDDMGDFDWNIYGRKAIKKFAVAALIGGMTTIGAYLGTEPVPDEYVWLVMLGSQIVDLALNAIKHKFSV